ncbi:ABC transporter permease [Mangrovihabitans endophyticus]|uniref:Transporter n=1 Tax=Mangrovihabitans endophyticus TaxID=1751298 RepID=A0A8J3BYW8_9ACTN|nr:ABC transporter permease [Mangrovihabitans endophyticus]GGK93881.1 transporter [Mangrovihabitans endophyticus]
MAVNAGPGTFIRLKLRVTAGGLRGRTGRVLLFVLGVLVALFLAIAGYLIFALPGFLDDPRAAATLFTLGGGALVLGWLLLPLVFFGVDESLDPSRFALLPLPRRVLVRGLFAAALTGVPAVAMLLATAGMVHAAALLGGVPAAATQMLGVLLGLFLCVAASRAVTSAFATALRSRRARDMATVLFALLAAMIGPLQVALAAGAQRADWDRVARLADVVAWTPLGAAFSMGPDVVDGRAWAVPVKLVIALASLGLLLWWWASSLEKAMLGLAVSGGRGRTAGQSRPMVEQLLVGALPRNRSGALISREIRYWWRGTRRRASLITFAVLGVFLPIVLSSGNGAVTMLPFVGVVAAISLANQFGYEGAAYASHIVAGVPGRVELRTRAAGLSVYVIPLLIVVAVLGSLITGEQARTAALLGSLLAAYGLGLAVALPISVRGAYALPDTTNPFATSSGAGMAKGLMTLGAMVVAFVGALPLQLADFLVGDVWLVLGLPVGVAYGAAAFWAGSTLAGAMLDRRMPEVLTAVTPNR